MPEKILVFKAAWCGPCKNMSPTIDELTKEGYPIEIIDVDEADKNLLFTYNIRGVPTVVVHKNHQITQLVGFKTKSELLAVFN